jgi:Tfp pilus assembly protein PilF
MAPGTPASLLASKNWSSAIKQLDQALSSPGEASQAQLLLNRGFCMQQLGLFRKALKVSRMAGMAEGDLRACGPSVT